MIKFLDGPAAGEVLALRRAPVLLRVVRSPRGKWDALDRVADSPAQNETVIVYRMTEYRGPCHMRCSPRSASGWYQMADYCLFEPQPLEMHVRDNAAWREWCAAQRDTVPVPKGWKASALGGET